MVPTTDETLSTLKTEVATLTERVAALEIALKRLLLANAMRNPWNISADALKGVVMSTVSGK